MRGLSNTSTHDHQWEPNLWPFDLASNALSTRLHAPRSSFSVNTGSLFYKLIKYRRCHYNAIHALRKPDYSVVYAQKTWNRYCCTEMNQINISILNEVRLISWYIGFSFTLHNHKSEVNSVCMCIYHLRKLQLYNTVQSHNSQLWAVLAKQIHTWGHGFEPQLGQTWTCIVLLSRLYLNLKYMFSK